MITLRKSWIQNQAGLVSLAGPLMVGKCLPPSFLFRTLRYHNNPLQQLCIPIPTKIESRIKKFNEFNVALELSSELLMMVREACHLILILNGEDASRVVISRHLDGGIY